MKLLPDTHVLLWLATEPEKIRAAARKALADRENEVYLSAACAWEIAIKYAVGKLRLPMTPAEFVATSLERLGLIPLPVTHIHASAVATLSPVHRDPFDRMIVVQSMLEGLTVVTVDPIFKRYGVNTLR